MRSEQSELLFHWIQKVRGSSDCRDLNALTAFSEQAFAELSVLQLAVSISPAFLQEPSTSS